MPLQGTLVNVAAIIFGCLIGRYLGHLIPERMRRTIMMGLGLTVLLIGMQLALQSRNPLIVIGAMVIGGIIGEALSIEARLENMGHKLQQRFKNAGNVAEAFVTASLLYCIGAMAIMGSIQDGLGQEPTILYAKSALDGIASVAFTTTLGIGVIFSVIPLLIYPYDVPERPRTLVKLPGELGYPRTEEEHVEQPDLRRAVVAVKVIEVSDKL